MLRGQERMMTMGVKIESAISFMETIAKDDSHGYSQTNRWGPDYDCSSLVITAWQQAGVSVKTGGATYTGNMYGVFKKYGFQDVTNTINLPTGRGLQRGDVLLNKRHHTAMYCGNGKEVEASINELGKAVGGKTGDQTGREILIRSYRNYPWDYVLRFNESSNERKISDYIPGKIYKDDAAKNGIQYKVTASGLNMRVDGNDTPSAKIVKVLHRGDKVYWYGYYMYDKKGTKWLFVTDGASKGYCSSKYLVVIR